MTEEHPRRTEAETRRSWWPGWIWAVPIAAIGVAGWLGLRALADRGPEVTVAFDGAYGAKAGDTDVTLKGLKVGKVSKIALAKDGRGVLMTLKLRGDARPYLRTGTVFWLKGAKVSLTDLSSVKAVFGGSEVVIEPGAGEPTRRFVGQDQEPPVAPLTAGTPFVLTADKLGSLHRGSPVYYSGKEVGKITEVRLAGPRAFQFGAFVRAPYDRYVTTATRFWNAAAVQVTAGSSGVRAQLVSPVALIEGGVAFDTPDRAAGAPRAAAETRFTLYEDEHKAKDAPIGPEVAYLVRFDGPVGGLKPGAAVELRGFRVGQVISTRLSYDGRTGALNTPVQIELEPLRFGIQGAGPTAGGDWRPAMNAMLQRLVGRGLRARLTQDPPVVGGRKVELAFVGGARPAGLAALDGLVEIPSASSGDLNGLMAKANEVMSKVDAVPIEQIGDNVRQISAKVRGIVSSPRIPDMINHLDAASREVDATVRKVGPQIGPLVAKLRQTADEADRTVAAADKVIGGDPESQDSDVPSALHQLSGAARSIRNLADYLERHPEALIKGKAKPKGSK